MHKSMRTLHIAGLLLVLSPVAMVSAFAQERQGDQQEPSGKAVRGVVVAAKSGSSLPGAIVELRSQADSVLVSKVSSKPDGCFSVEDIQSGKYFLKVTFTGHEPTTTGVLTVSDEQGAVEVGKIALKQSGDGLSDLSDDPRFTGEPSPIEPMERTVSIMRAALEHVYDGFEQPASDTLRTTYKLDPAGITGRPYEGFTDDGTLIPAEPASAKVQKLAEKLAAATPQLALTAFEEAVRCVASTAEESDTTPNCWSKEKGLVIFVEASIPEVHGAKARLWIHTWQPSASRQKVKETIPIGMSGVELELERDADGQWQVTGRGAVVVT